MRLWTLHPKYLDPQGLVALWREALLAQAVLHGKTRGYRRHPQLERFKQHPYPPAMIAAYLGGIIEQARERGYAFDAAKILCAPSADTIAASDGQIMYEWRHLTAKLCRRSPDWYARSLNVVIPAPHPAFYIVAGDVEYWERGLRSAPAFA